MSEAWLRGENGAVLTFGEPLPAGVAARLESGVLSRIPPPAAAALAPSLPAEETFVPLAGMPDAGAKRGEWARYAISLGADPGEVWKLSRDALAARFGPAV